MTVEYEDPRGPGDPATPRAAPASATDPGSEPPADAVAVANRPRMTVRRVVQLIMSSEDAEVEQAVMQLSRSHRWLAPLALVVGAFLMLLQGLKLLITNWRLSLVQIIPAMWIWIALLDIKVHLLHGKQFNVLRGPVLIPCVLGVTALTAASFYLNGVFAFAISGPRKTNIEIRPAFAQARRHLKTILAWGVAIGLALSFSALISTRWGRLPFALSQGIVVGIMMLTYLAVPARMVGVSPRRIAPGATTSAPRSSAVPWGRSSAPRRT